MPLSVQVSADKVAVRRAVTPGIGKAIFFENRIGRTSCLRSRLQSSSAVVDRLLPDCSVESLKRDFEILLAAHGLYAKEAEAMARAWEDSWFE